MSRTVDDLDIGISKMGDTFRKRYNKIVTRKQHYDILRDINKVLADHIVEGNKLYLPKGLGTIYVTKFRPKDRFVTVNGKVMAKANQVDFGATNKLRRELQPTWTNADWKKVAKEDRPIIMLNNDHSDGYRYTITWDKHYIMIPTSRYWSFKGVRTFTRSLASRIKGKNKPTYYEQKIRIGRTARESKEVSSSKFGDK